jgi:PAS domain S-box-containing protein
MKLTLKGRKMSNQFIIRKVLKYKFRQLEWLIIAMAGSTLGSLQIIRYVILSSGAQLSVLHMTLDWLFAMIIITGLVHFSFRELIKIQNELIDKREQADKAEKRMQHIIDMTQDSIFTIDLKGNFTFVNKSAEVLTGYPVQEILAMNIQDILTTEYRTFIFKKLNEFKDLPGPHIYINVAQKSSQIVPIEVGFIPIKDSHGELSGYQGVARDITERREVEKAHQEKEKYLQAIARVGQIILETTAGIPYKAILEILCKATGSHRGFVILHDADPSCILTTNRMADGYTEDSKKQGAYTQSPLVIIYDNGHSDTTKETELLLQSIYNHNTIENMSQKDGISINSRDGEITMLMPLIAETKSVGVIGFNKPIESGSWKSVHMNLLLTATNMLSQAIERQKTNEQLKRHFISLAKIISKALFAVDPYTASHQQRLAEMVCLVGERKGLPPKQLEWLYFCGLLHDVGKIAVPATILSKPGRLTNEEWGLVRSHVERGGEIIREMNLPDNVTNSILHHHERLDGSGYPTGIKGDELSLEARILGICDVVEAMSSHRPYRPARSREEIQAELKKGRGRKYDSQLVDLMLNMIENNEFSPCFQKSNEIGYA